MALNCCASVLLPPRPTDPTVGDAYCPAAAASLFSKPYPAKKLRIGCTCFHTLVELQANVTVAQTVLARLCIHNIQTSIYPHFPFPRVKKQNDLTVCVKLLLCSSTLTVKHIFSSVLCLYLLCHLTSKAVFSLKGIFMLSDF